MELKETAVLMASSDYKERFKAEYYQLKERYEKLSKLLYDWDYGILTFTPKCSRDILIKQKDIMLQYLNILKFRADIEEIKL